MKLKWLSLALIAVAGFSVAGLWLLPRRPSAKDLESASPASKPPRIRPDYRDIVIPPNIAPLNFCIEEPGEQFFVRLRAHQGPPIEVFSRSGDIEIPLRAWHRLLAANRGKTLSCDVYVRQPEGHWRRYQTVTSEIADEEIDSHIAYRLLNPDSMYYRDIGVYQRHLETYDESVVLQGRSYKEGCVNCHTFLNYDPENMFIGVRSRVYGNATLLVRDGHVSSIGTHFGHTAWHPSGRVAAFSRFDIRLFFHTARVQTRDAIEFDSLLGYYRLDTETLKTATPIADKKELETHPTWSPDGRYLYFASAPKLWTDKNTFPPERYAEVKYDLKRVSYDVDTDKWGTVETVLSAERTGRSILTPRISPDGRFLLFSMCDYGCFALYQPNSDLYLMDLETGDYRKLECNSPFAESWHAWSSNGRWIIFSSKRPSGMFTRLYFCHVDQGGNASKPFVLPQRDPRHYDAFVKLYNVPEFITGPIRTPTAGLVRAVRDPDRIEVDAITGATPQGPSPGL
ncbi:MAG: PD40 domain-containing protein [Pirellulaceae bacterium]|nr:PD40 domain-containing protein [Pirellulaceae bacterium]